MKRILWWLIAGTKGGKTRAELIEELSKNPANANQLTERLGYDYKTVRHHLNVLIKNGIIKIEKNKNNNAIYFISNNIAENLYSLNNSDSHEIGVL